MGKTVLFWCHLLYFTHAQHWTWPNLCDFLTQMQLTLTFNCPALWLFPPPFDPACIAPCSLARSLPMSPEGGREHLNIYVLPFIRRVHTWGVRVSYFLGYSAYCTSCWEIFGQYGYFACLPYHANSMMTDFSTSHPSCGIDRMTLHYRML